MEYAAAAAPRAFDRPPQLPALAIAAVATSMVVVVGASDVVAGVVVTVVDAVAVDAAVCSGAVSVAFVGGADGGVVSAVVVLLEEVEPLHAAAVAVSAPRHRSRRLEIIPRASR
jgi:hypothetical protein